VIYIKIIFASNEENTEKCEISSSESNDSLISLHTAIEYEIPDGFYLVFSENGSPWIMPLPSPKIQSPKVLKSQDPKS